MQDARMLLDQLGKTKVEMLSLHELDSTNRQEKVDSHVPDFMNQKLIRRDPSEVCSVDVKRIINHSYKDTCCE